MCRKLLGAENITVKCRKHFFCRMLQTREKEKLVLIEKDTHAIWKYNLYIEQESQSNHELGDPSKGRQVTM